jgi:chromosome partitioning protein
MGKIISIISQKGGVGKTTTTVNLGASLAAMELNTLVVGVDPQCGIATSFGYEPDSQQIGLYEALTQGADIRQALHDTKMRQLHAIPINVWNGKQEDQLCDTVKNDLTILRSCLSSVRNKYDYILIDCPPTLGPLTFSAMIAADSILIPVQCEYYTVATLSRVIAAAKFVKSKFNPNLSIEGLLITMVNTRARLSQAIIDDLKNKYKSNVLNTTIPRNIRLAEIPFYKKPAILIDILCPGSQAYLKLAKEIHERAAHAKAA